MAARASALSAGGCERSYPRPEVRGSGLECQAVKAQERLRGATLVQGQWRPGGATVRLRSEVAKVRGGKGQGWRPGGDTPRPRSGRQPRGATPHPRSGAAGRRHPASEGRGGEGQGRQPGGDTLRPRSVAARRKHPASEVRGNCREELSCSEGRGGREKPPRTLGAIPSRRPGPAAGRSILRSGGCAGPGGLRGAIPR